jgi:hypothetical protein
VSRAAVTWLVLLVLAATGAGVRSSGADFTAASTPPSTTATAAASFDTLAVALADPGEPLGGAVPLAATATSEAGVTEVRLQRSAAGAGSWTDICTAAAAPYGCTWSTTAVADGAYDLRAVATDASGRTRATTPLRRTVDNTAPTVVMTDPGTLSGAVTLASTASDGAGTGVERVRYDVRTDSGAWAEACTATAAPFGCSWSTTGTADGLVDLRAIATDGAGRQTTSAVLAGLRVDNTPPASATLADPGALLQGTTSFSGTATDAGAGIAAWTVQVRATGGTAWTDACSDTAAPYACTWASTAVADGSYDVRALARDAAGSTTASALRAGVRVDNAGPTLTVPDPGTTLRATLALTATASDPAGMQRVTFQRRAAGASTWTTVCDDTAAPWTCSFDTRTVPDGTYDLQVVATDSVGHTTTVAHPSRTIDNTAPAGTDVQAGNGGSTAGRLEANDWLRLTFSEPVRPQTIAPGWDGSAAVDVAVRITNAAGSDTLQVYDAADATQLGLTTATAPIRLNADFVSADTRFTARLTRSGAAYTVTLVALRSGTLQSKAAGSAALAWTPSPSVLDIAGNAAAATTLIETGTNDRDF